MITDSERPTKSCIKPAAHLDCTVSGPCSIVLGTWPYGPVSLCDHWWSRQGRHFAPFGVRLYCRRRTSPRSFSGNFLVSATRGDSYTEQKVVSCENTSLGVVFLLNCVRKEEVVLTRFPSGHTCFSDGDPMSVCT